MTSAEVSTRQNMIIQRFTTWVTDQTASCLADSFTGDWLTNWLTNPLTDDLQVLLSKGVEEGKILFLSLIAAPEGIHKICAAFPRVKVITSEIDEGIGSDYQVVPGESSAL